MAADGREATTRRRPRLTDSRRREQWSLSDGWHSSTRFPLQHTWITCRTLT